MNIRDLIVAALVAEGLRNIDIAKILGTSEHMVKNYLRRMFDDMGFWNRTELALWYVRQTFDKEQASEKVSNSPAARRVDVRSSRRPNWA